NPLGLNLMNVNGTLFLAADDGVHGIELWKSDGTEEGTVLVKDINPGPGHSSPDWLTNVNGTLFFTTFTPETGVELWQSDGSEEGTVLVLDILPGSAGSLPRDLTSVGEMLFFTANDGVHGRELWMATTDDGRRGGGGQRSLGESVRARDPRHILK